MSNRFRVGVAAGSAIAVSLAAAIGIATYNIGFAHGLAAGGAAAFDRGAGMPYGYFWPRPWGFGFFIPLAFLAFWFLVARTLIWRRPWIGGPYGDPRMVSGLDEWHRRAHAAAGGQEAAERKG
jgi:hypothetical protein